MSTWNIVFSLMVNLYYLSQPSHGQFPRICIQGNRVVEDCCPSVNGMPCGGQGKGKCTIVSDHPYAPSEKKTKCNQRDPRINWPQSLGMNRYCKCVDNWDGPDCSECTNGYVLQNGKCVERKSVIRKNARSMSKEEWDTFIAVLNEAKNTTSAYQVFKGTFNTEAQGNANYEFVDVTVYDLFVWMHYYAAKDNKETDEDTEKKCDFAHEASGFLTWHRAYLLFVERELQKMKAAEKITFAIPFWDWTEHSKEDLEWLFNDERMGSSQMYIPNVDMDTVPRSIGGPFGRWSTVCASLSEGSIDVRCNPTRAYRNTNGGNIERCLGCSELLKARGFDSLPTKDVVDLAIKSASRYDQSTWDKRPNGISSFRNALEGFVNMSTIEKDGDKSNHELHNQVHIYVGGDGGTMFQVDTSPNDPIFFLHHSNIDRIFEAWLRKGQRVFYPDGATISTRAHPGHNRDDYILPLFPLITHNDVFKTSDKLNYEYADAYKVSSTNGIRVSLAVILLLCALSIAASL